MALMIDVTVLDNHGEPHVNRKLNPLLKVVEAAERNVLTLARELGLTPLLRERVKPAKEDPKPNPLDAHLRPSGYTVEDQLRGRVPHD